MTRKEDIENYIQERRKEVSAPDYRPIFRILVFEKPDKELVYNIGGQKKPSGFPDMGAESEVGFYYALDDAIEVMHHNIGDIRETCYDAGFILCTFPGLYDLTGTESRIYFRWDDSRKGFFEQEEPLIFAHCAL